MHIFSFLSPILGLFSLILWEFGDCRGLVHLFCYRCLQMWPADCRRFTSEKTNSTLNISQLLKKVKTTLPRSPINLWVLA
ncbi:hypothetical protein Hanom_Chr16g01460851 [Helianthus anomalus]